MTKGEDVIIHPTAVITRPEHVEMGDHIAIDPFFYMTTPAKLGSYIHINSHVSVIGGPKAELRVGDYVAISTGSRLICRSDDFKSAGIAIPFAPDEYKTDQYGKGIIIENYAILGANVTILPDVVVGEGAVVGAGSLVNKSLKPWGIYAGSPATQIGERRGRKWIP